jgi:hypothetical protein
VAPKSPILRLPPLRRLFLPSSRTSSDFRKKKKWKAFAFIDE